MRVFVDAGVYMDYLKGNGVRIHVLETFEDLLEKKKFKLVFPKVTKEEIYRGIPMDYRRFSKGNVLKASIPEVPAGVEEGEKFKEAQDLLNKYNQVIEEVRKQSLAAVDNILEKHIERLLKCSEEIKEDTEILEVAQIRKQKGNPPGKSSDPLGDEIVWELLLKTCIDEDLVIIAKDNDWKYSDEGKSVIHPFLQKEWSEKSTNKIEIFSSLAPFIETIDPKRITKKDLQSEKKITLPLTYLINVNDGIRVSGSPSASLSPSNAGTIGLGSVSLSPSSSASISPSQWQPVTVVGTTPNGYVQCYSCGRIVLQSEYYGLTSKGYGCKYCLGS
ncbi:MAG: hypothetical protein A2700_01295 [Candidatus Blackburnbacteria bacterium RIFCSPHIGHO2_01_FULL_44_64]|uniref:DUF4935 domain-containing protein n=1 Tax=Candidatus Blackburnbacteria bacterium RIFCSPHIGHO2_02_FULL_44_20 TaxID=1797516 RepID=A0A1G1V6T6_9BACT|nr:MAG: hypothetical protein A2700_01295 [Candidatus Blackburnbacteria bacterium RIFCSPHIGHO2_01_FULL_44_64]OGY10719.1 MAG: hypothetical protein A3E16_01830 [Candidatus Blackburnbacteria bacterium RIFCSPHIGHO2_12_FULL_44_25]OGY11021.1 MAG: hypothetical protein A3D26_03840 [Candidatus Blackburnbacteria bacterium RIFCSPHIGHO2_02_FULL_44_20]OGY15215.1 MAG: hypothetical protein A3A62_02590 [Candidatus Blackburnbacteria bacterium RIFCSPLOWO2_01_FULL_44_43]OGY15850.1 MAG: hypothetical protein A3H88_0